MFVICSGGICNLILADVLNRLSQIFVWRHCKSNMAEHPICIIGKSLLRRIRIKHVLKFFFWMMTYSVSFVHERCIIPRRWCLSSATNNYLITRSNIFKKGIWGHSSSSPRRAKRSATIAYRTVPNNLKFISSFLDLNLVFSVCHLYKNLINYLINDWVKFLLQQFLPED